MPVQTNQTKSTSFQTTLAELEDKIAHFLLDNLEQSSLSPGQASQIAKFFLELFPEDISEQELEERLASLDQQFFNHLQSGDFTTALQLIQDKERNSNHE
jgi:hypothetical protein